LAKQLVIDIQKMTLSELHKFEMVEERLNILGKKLNRFIQSLERSKINKSTQKQTV